MTELWAPLTLAVVESVQIVLSTYGVLLEASSGPHEFDGELKSSVRLAGNDLNADICVTVTRELLTQSYPLGTRPTDGDLVDWCHEFSNQLVGCITRRLVPHAIDLAPASLRTYRWPQSSGERCSERRAFFFGKDAARLALRLDVEAAFACAGCLRRVSGVMGECPPANGELFLFLGDDNETKSDRG